ncbi:MAG: protoporphyrinogen oxidase [Chloroherpetonaceae bacterium]|nr:protoporphyrinogen oxidase [Chloroherpetonaceae bacterium]MCS7212311.1 protoporphyrinogen oxidase [Chloroherpetonaceae bacterium]MDW8020157.1 protoporphyrinogen oxidase [Chloroherpetonaceae bacterium]MDW8465973.1 protoporphyrinogen oxidase [Chloroherpetonaceae bacterium]
MNIEVAVIGAGLAGLSAAYRLKQRRISVAVIEAASQVGGKVQSLSLNGFTFDVGPNTVLESNEAIARLVTDLELRNDIIWASAAAKARYILKRGKLVALSPSPALLFSPLLSLPAKWRLLKEPFIPPSQRQETVAAFFERRFGREVLEYLIDPFLAGTFGARPEDIALESAFPVLAAWERQYGSVFRGALQARKGKKDTRRFSRKMFSFAGGFYEVIRRLSEKLLPELWLSAQVQAITRSTEGFRLSLIQKDKPQTLLAKRLLFATPASETAKLLEPLAPDLAKRLAEIPYSPIAQVFLGYKSGSTPPLTGFGFLVPSIERRKILGAVFNHAIFPQRYNDVALTVFIGGSRQPELVALSEAELTALACTELKEILGISATPIASAVVSWPAAIPQYGLSHSEILKAVAEYEQRCGEVFFAGNWRGGISVPDTVRQAEEVAQAILRTLAPAPSTHQLAH